MTEEEKTFIIKARHQASKMPQPVSATPADLSACPRLTKSTTLNEEGVENVGTELQPGRRKCHVLI